MWSRRIWDRILKREPQRGASGGTIGKGAAAEEIAEAYLSSAGYEVVERNYRCKVGEIDLIARHAGDLVFVEVKSSYASQGIDPVYQVTPAKRKKLIRAAKHYVIKHFRKEPNCRFDVVTVKIADEPIIDVIQNAFDEHGRAV